jgi:hypothetical protein
VLGHDAAQSLTGVPAAPGVGQIVGPDGRSLMIARPANLRRWAASKLGLGRPPAKGVRPPLDLRAIANEIRHRRTTSVFQQRLVYERLMALHVPPAKRRDLKPPAWIRIDLGERFPRLRVASGSDTAPLRFGPFRDRGGASRAVESLHRRLPLRPCDYVFEPDPALPLGLGCVYAQVRTCSAPCLQRIGEADYRALAEEAASLLRRPDARGEDPLAPSWVGILGARAVVVERGSDGVEIYPVRAGAVLEEHAQLWGGAAEVVAGALTWPAPEPAREDLAWLSAWLHLPRRTGEYLVVDDSWDEGQLADRLRAAVERVAASPK